ncbi:prolactin regulatory element-binding protein [Diorhabda carinulata]|uniref:prolactin regulatory element-binding protein n=1 Tax=Diorhabda carinulata TaxID=1163345 RepID=UPI0025A013B5|nr:prolactin regulatory element-binding protein [Diorhabda carinulata]
MSSKRRNKKDIIARVNFPLYTVQMLTSRHVIVGGGGGTSKTGVQNGFEIFEIFHDGSRFAAKEITRHETGGNVVMNCSVYSNKKHSLLAAGRENHCQLYKVNSKLMEEVVSIGNDTHIRQRNAKVKEVTDDNKNVKKELYFEVKPLDSVQTDFNGSEPLSRVVKINHDGTLLATGGTDCDVRIWKFPSMQPLFILKAHKKEIDDIDFSRYDNYIITVAKDGLAVLWDCLTGMERTKLTWKQPEGSKYLYKRCRFGIIEGLDKKCALYTIVNPTGLAKKQKSYLQQWIPEENLLKKMLEFDESLASLAVRDDGRFVAVGTMFSGSVSIHVAFSLQKISTVVGAHSMFVTGLEFVSAQNTNHSISSVVEAAVLSISVDNQLCIHTVPYRKTIPLWIGIVLLIFTLFLTFLFCAYLGL